MSMVTMCGNDSCEKRNMCYRYLAIGDMYNQSYIYDSNIECIDKDYVLFFNYEKAPHLHTYAVQFGKMDDYSEINNWSTDGNLYFNNESIAEGFLAINNYKRDYDDVYFKYDKENDEVLIAKILKLKRVVE